MVTFSYFMLGSLFISVCVLTYVVLNMMSRVKTIENTLKTYEYLIKDFNDNLYKEIININSDLRREQESIIRDYSTQINETYTNLNRHIESLENNLSSEIKDINHKFDLEISNVNRVMDSRMDKLDDKLIKTKEKTYFDFNQLLNEVTIKGVDSIKESLTN